MDLTEGAAYVAEHRPWVTGLWGDRYAVQCHDCMTYRRYDDETTAHREAERHRRSSAPSPEANP